jgi:hypothetical protein
MLAQKLGIESHLQRRTVVLALGGATERSGGAELTRPHTLPSAAPRPHTIHLHEHTLNTMFKPTALKSARMRFEVPETTAKMLKRKVELEGDKEPLEGPSLGSHSSSSDEDKDEDDSFIASEYDAEESSGSGSGNSSSSAES